MKEETALCQSHLVDCAHHKPSLWHQVSASYLVFILVGKASVNQPESFQVIDGANKV